MKSEGDRLTPMMRQYRQIKKETPNCVLFYRLGDFYEMFGEDAKIASKILGIALTTREKNSSNPIPMCGIPHHALNRYLPKMIDAGRKVAICDQMEDPKSAKGIVRRGVTRIISSASAIEEELLDERSSNFLVSFAFGSNGYALAQVDLSTGLFRATEFTGSGALEAALDEIARIDPKEICAPDNIAARSEARRALMKLEGVKVELIDMAVFGHDSARSRILDRFKARSLEGFGLKERRIATCAAGGALYHLTEKRLASIDHIERISYFQPGDYMLLDSATISNLELLVSRPDRSRSGSLLALLDATKTPMGARAMKEWIIRPLIARDQIERRLDALEAMRADPGAAQKTRALLRSVGDLERSLARVGRINPSARDLLNISSALAAFPEILRSIAPFKAALIDSWRKGWDNIADIAELIGSTIVEDAPSDVRAGDLIKDGRDARLDELRAIKRESRSAIIALEARARGETGVASLKTGYNRIFGYYFELSAKNAERAPADWVLKQSLVNRARYVSSELKELEEKIENANARAIEIELKIFNDVRSATIAQSGRIQYMASLIAALDLFLSLTKVAIERDYVRPQIDESAQIQIERGRHPLIESADLDEHFIPNDTQLNTDGGALHIITGPNMAGKSTYIRQLALITLMAQAGSFVPAEKARIGLVDRIFTRVGASDDLKKGSSTFMVEMSETANILNHATSRSLVILDEIGRGTSTFDGFAIAWAVAERLVAIGARALFATHYHELTDLERLTEKVRNMSVQVAERDGEVVFLRRLKAGRADRSYGIYVARLAGLPQATIDRAGEILAALEAGESDFSARVVDSTKIPTTASPPTINAAKPDARAARALKIFERVKRAKIDAMTPIEALNFLAELKNSG